MEKEVVISLKNVTKDYGRGRGIFDISFDIHKGEVFGYCGTNGSGKTTTIRHIMGFIRPNSGTITVKGMDAWKHSEEIKKYIGYIPGEINFPDVSSGTDFLKIQASLTNLKDLSLAESTINTMQLDPTANLKRMSKGMKQKTAIVSSMMNQPEILIFDEPTTGLDPLMRESFKKLVLDAKKMGHTIFMSSHMFDELEETCDRVGLIHDGKLFDIVDMKDIHDRPIREYEIRFHEVTDYQDFIKKYKNIHKKKENKRVVTVQIEKDKVRDLFEKLKKYKLSYIIENKYTLENYFLEVVERNRKDGSNN